MVGLLDIAPVCEKITVRGTELTVTGITGEGLWHIFKAFPEVSALMADRGQDVTGEQLVALAPKAVAATIAAGCGSPGDPDAIAVVRTLSAAEQLELLEAVLRLTFPKGLGPFVRSLTSLIGAANVQSALGDLGWEADTRLPASSKKSSPSDTHPNSPGDTPQGS